VSRYNQGEGSTLRGGGNYYYIFQRSMGVSLASRLCSWSLCFYYSLGRGVFSLGNMGVSSASYLCSIVLTTGGYYYYYVPEEHGGELSFPPMFLVSAFQP
jgi:hypothetical protein